MTHPMRNPWADYVRYREEKTKKIRIPTRPKMEMPQLAVWLRGLAAEMRDMGNEHQASCIHEEIGELHLLVKTPSSFDKNEARKEFLMAARLAARRIDVRREQCNLIPLTSASCEDLYNKAIHISMQLNDLKMAGLTAFEAATATADWRHNGETSVGFLERAIRLLEGEVNSQSTAYFHLILVYAERCKWQTCLHLLDNLWMILMKSRQGCLLVESALVECEIMTALIICMQSPSEVAGRHKCIYELYSRLHPVEVHMSLLEEGKNEEAEEYREQVQTRRKRNHAWNEIPEECCLEEELFWLVKDIVWMIYYGEVDNLEATLNDREVMETFPEHSKKLIPLVAARAAAEDSWMLPYDPSRALLQPQLVEDPATEENKLEEEEKGVLGEATGKEEEEEVGEEDASPDSSEREGERSWRMGRFLEDRGEGEAVEENSEEAPVVVEAAASAEQSTALRTRRKTMRERIEEKMSAETEGDKEIQRIRDEAMMREKEKREREEEEKKKEEDREGEEKR
ncbi:hypothetical protein PFISCL1PPCAC_22871, partial [Pristionchus fissidentatus]